MNTKIIWQRSRTVMQQFFDILFPVHCAGCQCSGHVFCPSCIAQIHPRPSPICQHCGALLPPGGKSETPSDESRGVLAEISTFPKILEGSAALVPSRQDCGPTRSNSRNTEAAQETPRTRMFSGRFQGGRQARLHALPVNAQLAPGREGESDRIEHAGQPCGIQIPLDQPVAAEPAVETTVEPLPEWLSRIGATRMTILREFGLMSRDL